MAEWVTKGNFSRGLAHTQILQITGACSVTTQCVVALGQKDISTPWTILLWQHQHR